MKLLLIPLLTVISLPNAVNALPFRNNLQFKTNIGTKILIKGNTVKSQYFSSSDLIPFIKDIQKKWDEINKQKLRDLEKTINKERTYITSYAKGEELDRNDPDYAAKERAFIKGKIAVIKRRQESLMKKNADKLAETNNHIQIISEDPNKIHVVNLSFSPINIDLNNNRSNADIESISCINPILSEEIRSLWEKYGLIEEIEDKREKKICEKYAKFK